MRSMVNGIESRTQSRTNRCGSDFRRGFCLVLHIKLSMFMGLANIFMCIRNEWESYFGLLFLLFTCLMKAFGWDLGRLFSVYLT